MAATGVGVGRQGALHVAAPLLTEGVKVAVQLVVTLAATAAPVAPLTPRAPVATHSIHNSETRHCCSSREG